MDLLTIFFICFLVKVEVGVFAYIIGFLFIGYLAEFGCMDTIELKHCMKEGLII